MKKLDIMKDFIIIVSVLAICFMLLKLTYNDGVKNCTEYGYSEDYCQSELIK